MNENFATAMRQATQHTRAANLTEATRIIQEALAGRSSTPTNDASKADIAPAATQGARTPFKADPNAEIVEPVVASKPKLRNRPPRHRSQQHRAQQRRPG